MGNSYEPNEHIRARFLQHGNSQGDCHVEITTASVPPASAVWFDCVGARSLLSRAGQSGERGSDHVVSK